MKIRVPNYFKDFKCIASKCEDTCCAGWGIVIDDEALEKYQKVQGDFGDRLRREIIHEGGENIFILSWRRCSLLYLQAISKVYRRIWWSKRNWNFFIMSRSCKNNFRKFKKNNF